MLVPVLVEVGADLADTIVKTAAVGGWRWAAKTSRTPLLSAGARSAARLTKTTVLPSALS